MGTFMTAYVVVWLVVVVYVGRVGIQQRRLQQTLNALQKRMQHEANDVQPPAKAA